MKKSHSKLFLIVLLPIVSLVLFLIIDFNKRKSALYETLDIEFKTSDVEYGSAIKAEDLVSSMLAN